MFTAITISILSDREERNMTGTREVSRIWRTIIPVVQRQGDIHQYEMGRRLFNGPKIFEKSSRHALQAQRESAWRMASL
jgi:hypothetical protein